jgi:anthranilate phosphoribosyltransferase
VKHLGAGKSLSSAQVTAAAAFLVEPSAAAEEKAGLLRALARKGETPDEIAAFVGEFLKLAIDPGIDSAKAPGPILDVVGTGGDNLNLFNVSTTAMFVLAGGGVCIVKHGNRGITGKSGGADVLEALGIKIDLPRERVAAGVQSIGLGFLFAPLYHPAFKAVAEARKILAAEGQRSIFNILGPLLNPARPDYQLIGVFDPALTKTFADILKKLGRKGAWIVHGSAGAGRGMDELSTIGINTVTRLQNNRLTKEEIDPHALGFTKPKIEDLVGGDAAENANILEGILAGAIKGPKRDLVALNAAAGFVITGKAKNLGAGVALAESVIDRGAAHAKMRAMQDLC